jgi:hypothetical protein
MSRVRLAGHSLIAAAALAALFNIGTTITPAVAESPSPFRVVADATGGGWKVHYDRVRAHRTDVYHIAFTGGEDAAIDVIGDGDTDLDCRVYDEYGNLIDSDTDATDYCVLRWVPAWSGQFRVEVINLGSVSNQYRLSTN